MPVIEVERLTFTFPADWVASKYDEWSFYRNQFIKQFEGIGAVDVIACNDGNDAFLIEVKDYRHPETTDPSRLPQAIANKVIMTLAAMLPAALRANDAGEKEMAMRVLRCRSIRVVAHIEQPRAHQPKVIPADVQQKLKQLLRAVDPHPKVVSMNNRQRLPWQVA